MLMLTSSRLFLMGATDFILNVSFTYLFLMPLRRTNVLSPMLRDVATKTLYTSVVRPSSQSSFSLIQANIVVIAVLDGVEMVRVCMISTVLDATLNALILYWISSGALYSVNHFTLPEITVTKASTAFGIRPRSTTKIDEVWPVNTGGDAAIERRHSI
uniref:Uncharacterized protein n=1 Tax=Moniliophthora roreri TaxID=221103 RepID=A0A0W0F086_MONRR